MQDDDLVGWDSCFVGIQSGLHLQLEVSGEVGLESREHVGGMMKFGCVADVGRETCEILGFQTVM